MHRSRECNVPEQVESAALSRCLSLTGTSGSDYNRETFIYKAQEQEECMVKKRQALQREKILSNILNENQIKHRHHKE
jgi:hypothetical protein